MEVEVEDQLGWHFKTLFFSVACLVRRVGSVTVSAGSSTGIDQRGKSSGRLSGACRRSVMDGKGDGEEAAGFWLILDFDIAGMLLYDIVDD